MIQDSKSLPELNISPKSFQSRPTVIIIQHCNLLWPQCSSARLQVRCLGITNLSPVDEFVANCERRNNDNTDHVLKEVVDRGG
jgi:hypothetical protein